ncbi:MAG: YCF48-related protein [Bacteroidota bacterium]
MSKLKQGFIIGFLLLAQWGVTQTNIALCDTNSFVLNGGVVLHKTSFRGLSVVNDSVIWASGNNGTIAKSTDGGKTFYFDKLAGYETCDFRDIEAFDAKNAIVMSTRAPAYILKTTDGGQTWKEVYKNTDTAVFLDAMDFWNDKKGVLVGDPIHNHFFMLYTLDGGNTWQTIDEKYTPVAGDGEAVFAASGTSLRCWGNKEFGFVTGGMKSSFYYFKSLQKASDKTNLLIQQGASAKGAFSFAVTNKAKIAVGGNYLQDSVRYKNFDEIGVNLYYEDAGEQPFGYRSCIEKLSINNFLACGTNGVDAFNYQDRSWKSISKVSFNTVRKAKKGNAVFLVGSKGKIAKMIF